MSGRSPSLQNGIETELRETVGGFIALCKLCEKCFDRLVASVTADSILLVALPPEQASENGCEPRLKAISLPYPVNAERTRAEYVGSDLQLTLEKCAEVG